MRRFDRTSAAALAVLVLASGCSGLRATPSASGPAQTGGPSSAAFQSQAGPTATPAATPIPTPTAGPTPVPVPARWVSAGKIDPGRAMTHAVLLTSGDVLIVGEEWTGAGEGPGALDTTANAEVYHASAGTWQKVASLNAFRLGMLAVPLKDGRALVTAGMTSDLWAYSSTKLFNPSTGKWTQPGLMVTARMDAAGTVLQDGRVLVAGGLFCTPSVTRLVKTAEIFDPATGKWKATGSPALAREFAHSVTLSDGRVLLVGGYKDLNGTPTATAEIWDPATGKWSGAGSLASPRNPFRGDFALVALHDGSALAVGGTASTTTSAERFDPSTLTWSAAGTTYTAAANRTVVVLADGWVLAAGGLVAGDVPTAAAELYNPASGIWTETVPLPSPRADAAAVLLGDGSVLLAGGDAGASKPGKGVVGGGYGTPKLMAEALRYIPAVP
jgi:hypothetical protein